MPYYHVIVGLKSSPHKGAIEENLLEQDLVKNIVNPYNKGETFKCGDYIVSQDDISYIKITKSEQTLHVPTYFVSPESYFADHWQAINRLPEVTDKFIKTLPQRKKKTTPISKKVFIVHGRDDRPALRLQKYLKDKLKVDAVMFDDLPDKGRTIIEQLEYIQENVGYAFVIVTPDDVGCLAKDITDAGMLVAGLKSVKGETVGKIFEMFHTRARQNVVFEFGLFIGALGRERVCCLLKKDTEERPSDIDGILYKPFDKSVSEIFHEIPEELTEAGFEIKM